MDLDLAKVSECSFHFSEPNFQQLKKVINLSFDFIFLFLFRMFVFLIFVFYLRERKNFFNRCVINQILQLFRGICCAFVSNVSIAKMIFIFQTSNLFIPIAMALIRKNWFFVWSERTAAHQRTCLATFHCFMFTLGVYFLPSSTTHFRNENQLNHI